MKILKPKHETLEIEGKLSYTEGHRAWNVIRLKNELLQEFPQLKERRKKFGYKLVMHRSFKDLRKEIKSMENRGEAVPILMLLCED
jgi:hypothetical protein